MTEPGTENLPADVASLMRRDPVRWQRTSPRAVIRGSRSQIGFCIADAIHDIAILAASVRQLSMELDRVKATCGRLRDDAMRLDNDFCAMEGRAESAWRASGRLAARLAEAEKVIEPFVRWIDGVDARQDVSFPDDAMFVVGAESDQVKITGADFRAARAFLHQIKEGSDA